MLRLPAGGDNAAMQTEPPKAEPPKRQRRWFQFSLRTLLIGVTLLAVTCWIVVDRQRLIRERDEALQRAVRAEESVEAVEAVLKAKPIDDPERKPLLDWLEQKRQP